MSKANTDLIEQQIWEYIDGTCSHDDRLRINKLIQNDKQWQQLFNELCILNNNISNSLQLIENQKEFSDSVLNAIEGQSTAAAPIDRYINKNIIRAIAVLLSACMVTAIIYIASATHIVTEGIVAQKFSLPSFQIPHISGTYIWKVAIGINVILGLLMLDTILRTRRGLRHLPKA